MSDYEEFGYDMYVDKEREVEYLADTGLCGGFMRMTPVPPRHTQYGGYYNPQQKCNMPSYGYRSKFPYEVKKDIFETLTVKECQILNNVRYTSSKEDIEEYVEIIQKLINMGVFDDVPVDTHESVLNRYGQMKVNPCSSSTCETCVACDDECEEESDCDDKDNSSDSSTKREIVITQAFELRNNFIYHDRYIRSSEDCEVPNQSFEIGIDDPEKPINYSTVSDMFTTILRICLDHVVERTAAINMVMELMSEIGDEADSTLIAYCDSDCAEKLKDYIDTLYNNEIKVTLIGAPDDHVIGIRVNLPGNEMVAIPLVLHVMSYLWADIPNSYDATPTPPSSDGFDVRRVLDLI